MVGVVARVVQRALGALWTLPGAVDIAVDRAVVQLWITLWITLSVNAYELLRSLSCRGIVSCGIMGYGIEACPRFT